VDRVARRTVSFSDAMRLFGGGGSAGAGGAGEGPRGGRDDPPAETVSQLAVRIKAALETLGDTVRVRGEISNFIDKGHWYFSLKDESAVIGCAMWQEQARRVGWTPREGDAVVLTGNVSFFPKQGRTQLYVKSIERVGAGSLQERYEALCRELRGLGYFDEGRKLRLPSFPRRVAIVTSATGAAIHDCLRTAAHRAPAVGLVLVDVRVQGDGAAKEVARAIVALEKHGEALGIDAILVTRGGGSIEDLWAFNDRELADAVFARRRIPIVAAIGHESDVTIIELVADRRASTPTQAMMLLTPDRAELAEQIDALGDRLRSSLRRAVRERREVLQRIGRHAFLRSPLAAVESRREALQRLGERLSRSARMGVDRARHALNTHEAGVRAMRPDLALDRARQDVVGLSRRLERAVRERRARSADRFDGLRRQLEGVSPERVLARGYSYTVTADGRLVRSVVDAPPGILLDTRLADGTVRSRVEDAAAPRAARPPAKTTSRTSGDPSAEPSSFDLFGQTK
jgi:exodeoxyribonuclease VII large subunit